MRPLPPKYLPADAAYYAVVIGLIVLSTFTLDHVWESLDIQMGRSRMYINPMIGALLGTLLGVFVSDRFYKLAYLRGIYGGIPLSVHQSRRILLYGDVQDIYARAVETMKELQPKEIRCDPERGTIMVRTRRSRWSWGERMQAILSEGSGECISLEIHSRPIVPTAYSDRGMNAIIVEYIIARMNSLFRTRTDTR